MSSLNTNTILNELELDAYSELLNMGVGRAANNLSQLANEHIELTVPSVALVNFQEAQDYIEQKIAGDVNGIEQSFNGPFSGNAFLVFPQKQSLELVKRVVGESVSIDDISELEQDALKEVGNVFLTSCLGVIADAFNTQIQNSLPDLIRTQTKEILEIQSSSNINRIFSILDVNFKFQESNISGLVIIILNLDAIEKLKCHLNNYLKEQGVINE